MLEALLAASDPEVSATIRRWVSEGKKHNGDKIVKDNFCERKNNGEHKYNEESDHANKNNNEDKNGHANKNNDDD